MSKSLRHRQHAVNTETIETTPAPRTPAGDAFSILAILVLRIGGFLAAAGDDLSRPVGQTSARWQILASVEHEPVTVAQIARTLGLARQSVQRIADVLTEEGLTAYEDNPAHRRAKLLRLLPDGRTVLRAIQAAQRPWANALGAQIGESDLRRASKILERVLEVLAGPREE
jgi:DNA-binding MarR family transcriptional regulator